MLVMEIVSMYVVVFIQFFIRKSNQFYHFNNRFDFFSFHFHLSNFSLTQDVWAYCAVGIPVIRIFTINPKGELKHELNKTFQSTYHSMAYIVDQLFPPVNDRIDESMEFSSFNFWREPVICVNCDELLDANATGLNGKNDVPRVQRTPATPLTENNDLPTILEKA